MASTPRKPTFTVKTLRTILQKSNKFDQAKDEFDSICQIIAKHLTQNTSVADVSKHFRGIEQKWKKGRSDEVFINIKTNLSNGSYLKKYRDVQLSALRDVGFNSETDLLTTANNLVICSQEDDQLKSSRPTDRSELDRLTEQIAKLNELLKREKKKTALQEEQERDRNIKEKEVLELIKQTEDLLSIEVEHEEHNQTGKLMGEKQKFTETSSLVDILDSMNNLKSHLLLKQNESCQKEKESHRLLDALEELKPKVITLLDLTNDFMSQTESCKLSEEKEKKKQKTKSKRPEKLRSCASPMEFVQYTNQVLNYTKRLFPRLHDLKQYSKAIEDLDAWVTSTEESLMSGEVIRPLPVTQDSCQNTSIDPLFKTRKGIKNIYDDCLKQRREVSKLRDEVEHLKSENDKQQEQNRNREEDTQKKIQSLQEELRDSTTKFKKMQKHEKELTKRLEDYNMEAEKTLAKQMILKDSQIKQLEMEKNELLNRISKNAEMRLKEGNSGITDLSDPNRPTKLAEKFGELYDDEWTEAFDELLNQNKSEMEAIGILLQILRDANTFCKEQADIQFEDICKAICRTDIAMPFPTSSENDIRHVRRLSANISVKSVIEEYIKCNMPGVNMSTVDHGDCQETYIRKCVEYCWLMQTQIPPPWLHFDVKCEDPFEEDIFKFYTCRGKVVHFLVWPALHSKENGDLLRKGVCQGRKS